MGWSQLCLYAIAGGVVMSSQRMLDWCASLKGVCQLYMHHVGTMVERDELG